MFVGNTGTGKTAVMMNKLRGLDPEAVAACVINMNSFSDAPSLQLQLEGPLEKKSGVRYGPPGSRRCALCLLAPAWLCCCCFLRGVLTWQDICGCLGGDRPSIQSAEPPTPSCRGLGFAHRPRGVGATKQPAPKPTRIQHPPRLVYFIDDLNMPYVDKYDTQSSIELARQMVDYRGWYDKQKILLKEILNCQYAAAMNPTAGSFNITPRMQRHFVTFAVQASGGCGAACKQRGPKTAAEGPRPAQWCWGGFRPAACEHSGALERCRLPSSADLAQAALQCSWRPTPRMPPSR
jgi:hypothetical protein